MIAYRQRHKVYPGQAGNRIGKNILEAFFYLSAYAGQGMYC